MNPTHPEFRRIVTQAAVATLTDDLSDPNAERPLDATELGRQLCDDELALADADLYLGMRNVALHLLIKLEKLGQSPEQVLQDIGLKAASLKNRGR